ncbi:citramalate synthase [Trichothermofontia sp.]
MTFSSAPRLWLYDTTLRDGAQREGISLSLEDKLRIARLLDKLGVPFIEGGWPGANPKDIQFFWRLREEPLTQAEPVAFCSTRRPHTTAAADSLLQTLLSAGTRWVTIFGKSWDLHVTEGLKTTLEENLAMIADTIAYLRSQGRRVIYDAEHWFDGYRANPGYALETLKTAIAAGAEWLVFCDTNGGSLPHEITRIVQEVITVLNFDPKGAEGHQPRLGIHTHNDAGTAVANAIAAVAAGVTMVQGTINGYGERCGNADLCTLIPNLQLKLGYDCIPPAQMAQLTHISRATSEIVNLAPNDHAPFVGQSAFAHKGGIHVSAVERNPATYEHIPPEVVGNSRRIVISDQSGMSNILVKARTFGIHLERHDPTSRQILQRLKELESEGYQFEAAEASFDLLMREVLGQRQRFFDLQWFQVHCGSQDDALATVKVRVEGQEILAAAEGNGPVSALDAALRKALLTFYPTIADWQLTDYKVRIIDGAAGTSAKTRVLIEASDRVQRWTTVGVSTNIIDASCRALIEGFEYGLLLQTTTNFTAPANPVNTIHTTDPTDPVDPTPPSSIEMVVGS